MNSIYSIYELVVFTITTGIFAGVQLSLVRVAAASRVQSCTTRRSPVADFGPDRVCICIPFTPSNQCSVSLTTHHFRPSSHRHITSSIDSRCDSYYCIFCCRLHITMPYHKVIIDDWHSKNVPLLISNDSCRLHST